MGPNSESPAAHRGDRDLRRRTVLQGLGAGAAAGVGLVGTAKAHGVEGKPVFCGCSQLCVCMEGHGGVLMAQENADGGYDVGFLRDGELVPYPQDTPPHSGNFCVSTDDENVPEGKIIGLQVAGTRWVNPNQCAKEALEAEQEQLDSTHPRPEGERGGPCGKPPCEHPGGENGGNGTDSTEVTVTWEDCQTVTLTGPDDDLEKIDIYLIRCFDDDSSHKTDLDGSTGCPTGHILTREDPDLPLTLGRDELALGDEQYVIDAVDLFGVEGPDGGTAKPPDDLDCSLDLSEMGGEALNIEFEMDDQTITLAEDEDAVSQVTVTGTAEFGFAGWEDVGHAFISVWTQSNSIDTGGATNSDAERYFEIDHTNVVRNYAEVTFDVPPEIGDPELGEATETEILGVGFFGLERGTDPEDSENIGDWRDNDSMILRIEREE